MPDALCALLDQIAGCRVCIETPKGAALPHGPRPVLRIGATARLAICGQAPGARVHASGVPFTDPSGVRLRDWMGVTTAEFYDASRVAIVPMGFCFPGNDAKGGDRPPRPECAATWRARVFEHLPALELILLVGGYAQAWHLGQAAGADLTSTVRDWRRHADAPARPRFVPLPHPSWRNNGWLKRNPWFDQELVPRLKQEVRAVM